jgi:molybdenum storage protein
VAAAEPEAACATPAGPKARGCAQEISTSDGACARKWISSRPAARPRSIQGGLANSERKQGADASVSRNWELVKMHNEALDRMTMALVGASLTDEAQMGLLDTQPVIQILPDANVIKIGGQSFIDRGRAAVFPLIEEIVENLPRHKMIIGTGAGTRARHAYSVGLDLGMPTGVLSVLGFFVSIQNAKMIHYLLAKYGIPSIEPAQFAQLPLYLAERQAVVSVGMPPYAYWQPNPEMGRIPPHRTDAGCYLISEVFGARSMIYVKDEDGLYTADPKKDRTAKFIPEITVEELEQLDLVDVVLEHTVFQLMRNARNRRSVQVINGLKRGNLTRALNGERVGTIITS